MPRTSTGLLIPRFHADIAQVYSGDTKGAPEILQQLLEVGALKPSTEGEGVYDLVHTGVDNLLPPGLKTFERHFSDEWIQVHFGAGEITMSMCQSCHEWRMRLKPIVLSLSDDDALVFFEAMSRSALQGPWFWDDIIGFGCDDGEGPGNGEDGDDLDERVRLRKQKPDGSGALWLKELTSTWPCLLREKRVQTLMEIIIPDSRRKTTPELRALIDEFIAATNAAEPYTDNHAIMCTSWDQDCHINHAHDWLVNAIHNGDMGDQDGAPFAFGADSVAELKEGLDNIGRFIAAATKLEEWSNATDRNR